MFHDEAPSRRVVFFGDSRAAWWPVPVLPGLACVASGVPGATAGYLARRFTPMVAPLRPDIVVIQMGVNDLAGSQPSAAAGDVVHAIAAVVAGARALGAQVILTTIFPIAGIPFPDHATQAAIDAVNAGLHALAAPGVMVFDSATVLAGADGYLQPAYAADTLHLNAAGYAALNAALAQLLTPEEP